MHISLTVLTMLLPSGFDPSSTFLLLNRHPQDELRQQLSPTAFCPSTSSSPRCLSPFRWQQRDSTTRTCKTGGRRYVSGEDTRGGRYRMSPIDHYRRCQEISGHCILRCDTCRRREIFRIYRIGLHHRARHQVLPLFLYG
ncbi:hypothetical protein K440DRAFT_663735, partial [Wilcoxina mikolae CBS 423.85]